ncbi:hypothetical protein [Tardiphaga sp.]|jgi:hypothetical protein|uniref:hypothetical protein n=1 Tax=Tardiphaga sp. TaxID=1926292 RepID=UPI0025DF6731|nr:hypothetical protein [Tardiphaga sp.]
MARTISGMRYEKRLFENGWAVWDRQADAPAIVDGHTHEGLSMEGAGELAHQLNRLDTETSIAGSNPAAEEDLGGGDICSLEAEPSIEDDKPLE